MDDDFRKRYNDTFERYIKRFKQYPPTAESDVPDLVSDEYIAMLEQALKDGKPLEPKPGVLY